MNSDERDEGSDTSESNETAFDSNEQTEPGDTAAETPRNQDGSKTSLAFRAIGESALLVIGVLGFIVLAVTLVVTTLDENDNKQYPSKTEVDASEKRFDSKMDGKKRGWHQKKKEAKKRFDSKMDGKKRGWHQKRGFRRDFNCMTPQMKQKGYSGTLTPRRGDLGSMWPGPVGPGGMVEPEIDFYSDPMLLGMLSMLLPMLLGEMQGSLSPDMLMKLYGLEGSGEDMTEGIFEDGIFEGFETLFPFEPPEILGEPDGEDTTGGSASLVEEESNTNDVAA